MATLFEKVNIGGLELKNRMVMTPMGFMFDIDNGISERQRNYLVERARGGFGLVYPATHFIEDRFEKCQANALWTASHADRLSLAVEQVHQYGAKFALQLSLGLGRVSIINQFTAPKSASEVPSFWYPNLICQPFTKEEIHWMVEQFGYSASLAKCAGVDVLEIHAYGGYLIDQFISSNWNKRTDEYGGSLENRLRIVFELRDAVRATCGDDFPVAVKFTPDHSFEGGRTMEEGIEIAKMLDDAGFAYLHLDRGAYECWYNAVTTTYQERGCQVYIAEALREAGIRSPFMIQGKMDDADLAEKVVAEGTADLIGLGHPSLADPHWPKKVKAGLTDDIIPCIGCNECLYNACMSRFKTCAINPATGFEKDYELKPAAEAQKILVIGGGPGGMTAAITAAKRGFEAELWEKSAELGGTLKAAGAPLFKYDTKRYMDYLIKQVHKHGVTVRLRKEATEEEILRAKPDVVILAAGSKAILPRIPGCEKGNVVEATTLLAQGIETGEKVVVLGGGLVGCETALMLEAQGKDVTIVEMLDQLLLTAVHAPNNDQALKDMIAASRIKVMTSSKLTAVKEGKVCVNCDDGGKEIDCDTLVLSVGFRSDHSLAEALEGKVNKVFTIGDNVQPGKIIHAVHQGFHTIRLLEDL